MSDTRRVALVIETSNEYARGLLHGVRAYMREHEPWSIYLGEHSRGKTDTSWLKGWKGDGIIARIENRRVAHDVVSAKLPTVDVSAARFVPQFPMVETDDRAMARAAAEHLVDRGLTHFGFAGASGFQWSQARQRYFRKIIVAAGFDCAVYTPRAAAADKRRARAAGGTRRKKTAARRGTQHAEIDSLAAWIAALPKPIGIMAAYDIRGRQVLEACRSINVIVPDEVAVVGVDNDELLCDLADPPLTSVAPDTDRTGYLAAELLDRMMRGERVPPDAHLIPPIGVVARESTDMLAHADRDIAEAVRFIRDHACRGIGVPDVLDRVSLTRRMLDMRFRKLLGRTVHDEIRRVQLDRVRELLRDTDMPLAEVAHRAGFKHVEYLSVVFKKATGQPPSVFRERRGG